MLATNATATVHTGSQTETDAALLETCTAILRAAFDQDIPTGPVPPVVTRTAADTEGPR